MSLPPTELEREVTRGWLRIYTLFVTVYFVSVWGAIEAGKAFQSEALAQAQADAEYYKGVCEGESR